MTWPEQNLNGSSAMARPLGVLMVCLGNICRSPMGEGALRARLQEAGLQERVLVDSAAIGQSHIGHAPDERAIACAARHGIDIAHQRARALVSEDFDNFDYILCADRGILHEVRIRKPRTSHSDVELLMEWSGGGETDVPDPYCGDRRDFERAFKLVDAAAQGVVERIHQGRF